MSVQRKNSDSTQLPEEEAAVNLRSRLGATCLGEDRCHFLVWAPLARQVEVHIVAPHERFIPLWRDEQSYFHGIADNVESGSLYFYRLDGCKECPDPASRLQSRDVHGPSQAVDLHFAWEDRHWGGIPLRDYIIYELHTGTFTSEGNFDAIIPRLDELKELGITAVELMPIAQFSGERNWGYDGVYPFAVQNSYGGPEALLRLVNACHKKGIAVILDVVYNHLGPEGNYLGDFGPYFTDKYKTTWGAAINFDGPGNSGVRRFFVENALQWLTDYHIDALRLDSVHAIFDNSDQPFLKELAETVKTKAEQLNRRLYLIAESADNNPSLIRSRDLGGYGLDAQWNDDFHHSLHVLLTGEKTGYYQDFGPTDQLVKAIREGFVYSGQFSKYRNRAHGSSSQDIPAERFVVFAQNHDQVGNRMLGERLTGLASFETLKLAAGLVLLSPFIPLLFMGEEYGETAPFLYFVSHSDPDIIDAVRNGRREEFAAFHWQGEPPDPQDEATYQRSKVNYGLRREGNHLILWRFYRELIRLRKELSPLADLCKDTMEIKSYDDSKTLFIRRWSGEEEIFAVFHPGDAQEFFIPPLSYGLWHKKLDSAEERWNGPGSTMPVILDAEGKVDLLLPAHAFALFFREKEH